MRKALAIKKRKILFIIHELEYSGAPRCMLEMCKIAKELGYDVTVWSAKSGPFEDEFRSYGFGVEIVLNNQVRFGRSIARIKEFDLAICNTIITDDFARICCRYIPTIWYLHESVTIPLFVRNNQRRLDWLKNSRDIVCVSEFAAEKIRQYTNHRVSVVRNCMEDVSGNYAKYTPGSGNRVRFIQLGYLHEIKGYDILLEAFRELSPKYQKCSELVFAGRIVPESIDYGKQIVSETKVMDNVTYLGELTKEEAMRTLSEVDVAVLASRGESCSMFVIEGAMMAKPLIVTEDVGNLYLVKGDNGYIVKTGDVNSLKCAIEKMIDRKDALKEMGDRSRSNYEEMASIDTYRQELRTLFRRCEKKDTFAFMMERARNQIITNEVVSKMRICKQRGIHDTWERLCKKLFCCG